MIDENVAKWDVRRRDSEVPVLILAEFYCPVVDTTANNALANHLFNNTEMMLNKKCSAKLIQYVIAAGVALFVVDVAYYERA